MTNKSWTMTLLLTAFSKITLNCRYSNNCFTIIIFIPYFCPSTTLDSTSFLRLDAAINSLQDTNQTTAEHNYYIFCKRESIYFLFLAIWRSYFEAVFTESLSSGVFASCLRFFLNSGGWSNHFGDTNSCRITHFPGFLTLSIHSGTSQPELRITFTMLLQKNM